MTASPIRIDAHLPELVAIRRDIHAHPELGLEEARTAALVAARLSAWGIEHATGIGKTGVVATIHGKRGRGRSIGLRADMDALAMQEETGLPYASAIPGKMHGCGHDGHTTMLLGAARHLAENRDFAGTVHLIFQPAEEGRGGATAMLDDGLFERFPCDAVYGMHNGPGLPVGSFATRPGPFMAGGGSWKTVFRGNGGHGGKPHTTIDLMHVQAHYVLGLQTVVTRNMPAVDTGVITVCGISGGSHQAQNVMPAEVVLSGTMRYYNPEVRKVIAARMPELAAQCAALHGASAETELVWVAVPVVNHAEQTAIAVRAAGRVATGTVNGNADPITGGEDFSFMLERKPGAFVFMGNGVAADGSFHNVHTPRYDFNDAIIPLGVAYWAELVREELGQAA